MRLPAIEPAEVGHIERKVAGRAAFGNRGARLYTIGMTFKPRIWQPISILLSAGNLVGVGLAAGASEPVHAGIHAVLGLAFGLWAQRLGRAREDGGELQSGLDALELEVMSMRRELGETQERLDFAERLLAQNREAPRVGSERPPV